MSIEVEKRTLRCRRCGQDKAPEDFPRHPQMKTGRDPKCKACHRMLYRERAGFAWPVCWFEKRCRLCDEAKPLTKFPKRAGTFDGRDTRCHRCKSAACRQHARERLEVLNG